MELWGFEVDGVWLSPNFQRPLAAKLCVRPQKFSRCKNVLEVLYRRAKFGRAPISRAAVAAKSVEYFLFVCMFVCSSCFWTSKFVRLISPWTWRRWSTETILMLLDRRMFVVVHLCSTISDCSQLAIPLNAESLKIVGFCRQIATS